MTTTIDIIELMIRRAFQLVACLQIFHRLVTHSCLHWVMICQHNRLLIYINGMLIVAINRDDILELKRFLLSEFEYI